MTTETQYASPEESSRLIDEIQHLIEIKGMKMDMLETNAEADTCTACENQVVGGCTGCSLCACMKSV